MILSIDECFLLKTIRTEQYKYDYFQMNYVLSKENNFQLFDEDQIFCHTQFGYW